MRIIERVHTHWSRGTLFRKAKTLVLRMIKQQGGNRYYGKVASGYNKRTSSEKWKVENAAVEAFLAMIPSGSRVLDVPLGTGRFIPYYLEGDNEVWGIDISEDMIEAAVESLGVQANRCSFRVARAEELPFKDNFFDLVVCFRFLSYIVPFGVMKEVLAELYRVSNGYAILNLPIRREGAKDLRPPKDAKRMLATLKRVEVERLLGTIGFSVIDLKITEESIYYYDAAILCKKNSE